MHNHNSHMVTATRPTRRLDHANLVRLGVVRETTAVSHALGHFILFDDSTRR